MPPIYSVAIDLSKYKHTATILDTATTSVCKTVAIPVSQPGFRQFEAALAAFSTNPEDFVIGCEATGHYGETLLRRLQDKGFPHRAHESCSGGAVSPRAGQACQNRCAGC